ncbi:hypothetical protein [Streptomyces sp. NPDC048419]|uniref:hypothetical protein n=1 Tax=Streptomyces sp. NPDC048419 TaxID=3365547 RepID=UPI003714EF8A
MAEHVPGGWYEIRSASGEVRMDFQLGHGTVRATVNGCSLDAGGSGARRIFERWPSPFTAVLIVSRQSRLAPGRYLVTRAGVTRTARTVFDAPPF